MKQHILLERAKSYTEPRDISFPDGYKFAEKQGYWINDVSGEAMMLSKDAQRQQSKKCDRETGEDQKGE